LRGKGAKIRISYVMQLSKSKYITSYATYIALIDKILILKKAARMLISGFL